MSASPVTVVSLTLGLWYVAAALGELRRPGQWLKMVDEIARSPFAQMLGAASAIGIGALLVALTRLQSGDWLEVLLSAIGCVALLEGVVLLIAPERMMAYSRAFLRNGSRAVALVSLLLGLAFGLAGLMRI